MVEWHRQHSKLYVSLERRATVGCLTCPNDALPRRIRITRDQRRMNNSKTQQQRQDLSIAGITTDLHFENCAITFWKRTQSKTRETSKVLQTCSAHKELGAAHALLRPWSE